MLGLAHLLMVIVYLLVTMSSHTEMESSLGWGKREDHLSSSPSTALVESKLARRGGGGEGRGQRINIFNRCTYD